MPRRLILEWLTFAALLTLTGCPPSTAPVDLDAPELLESDADDPEASAEADEEYRRRVAVWFLGDDDKDGLSNKIEFDFGLDPEDPTDGPDIDGDGVPNFRDDDVDGDGIVNETDPDIDGDGLFNLLDADLDGDGVGNDSDFDMDTDGVRNAWDWDDNSNGKDDAGEGDSFGQLEETDLRFAAAVQSLKEKSAAAADIEDVTLRQQALSKYQGDLRDLLAQVSKVQHAGQPVPVSGKEIDLIAASLANRFKWGGSPELASDVKDAISQLTPLHGKPNPQDPRTFLPADPADAIDAVFRQATDIKEPDRAEAARDLQNRLDALTGLKKHLGETEITPASCSDAVSRLVAMPGDASPQDRVNGVNRLWDILPQPRLGDLVTDLGDITKSFEQHMDNWSWDMMVDALERLNALRGEGSLREKFASLGEKFDGAMRIWDKLNEASLERVLTGLEQLDKALGDQIEGAGWSWEEVISALESAPGIENGIGTDQINYAVQQVAEE